MQTSIARELRSSGNTLKLTSIFFMIFLQISILDRFLPLFFVEKKGKEISFFL
ncbi:hypothetical protein LEP1GSC103_0108 [Leptospira borgpetersenii serovar Javanica str. UI 09931]|uniref:Uncharacterized protein n=1 Tax=Leptospira borgpetersenii serovar Javanica str. UI 09931 TaxID=1049767 RepID=A0AAV3JH57_LEPBO|nr:hypothetical protein LEP1GSC103_0108 [Leptospira borgpetersenii serovar Javanica str. UI 09931]